jgi:hypothetical protein
MLPIKGAYNRARETLRQVYGVHGRCNPCSKCQLVPNAAHNNTQPAVAHVETTEKGALSAPCPRPVRLIQRKPSNLPEFKFV